MIPTAVGMKVWKLAIPNSSFRSQLKVAKWNILIDAPSASISQSERTSQKIEDLSRNMQLMTFAFGAYMDFMNPQASSPLTAPSHRRVDFYHLFSDLDSDRCGVAASLSLLAYSVRNEKSLPPYLSPPSQKTLRDYFADPERAAQHITHVGEPGSSTFALMRIGTVGLYEDLEELFHIVRDMVVEYDTGLGSLSMMQKSEVSDSACSLRMEAMFKVARRSFFNLAASQRTDQASE